MSLDIITTNPYGNPAKGKLFEETANSFQNADISGLGDTAYKSLALDQSSNAGKTEILYSDPQWPKTYLQPSLGGMRKIAVITPVDNYGIATTASGSTTPALTATNLQTRSRHIRFDTGTGVTSVVGIYTNYSQWWRGTATGEGGFLFNTVFSQNTNVSGHSVFIGLCESTTTLSGEPSSLLNTIGIGYDSTDSTTGNWYIIYNDGSGGATKVDTGTPRNTTSVLEFSTYCKGASGNVTASLINRSTSSVLIKNSTYTSNLPSSTVFLAYKAEINNNSTASNGSLLLYKTYIESPE